MIFFDFFDFLREKKGTCGVVGQTGLETEPLELVGGGLTHHTVAGKGGVDDLADDLGVLGVGQTDNVAVFVGVVLVIILGDQVLAGIVVGFSL